MASEDEDEGTFLSSFLFGNINKEGKLEDESLLDEESKRHIAALSTLGGQISLREILDEDETIKSADSVADEAINSHTSELAFDYSDITEAIDYDEDDDYDAPGPSQELQSPTATPIPSAGMPEILSPTPEIPVSQHQKQLVTPLADMLPPEYRGKDVREFFPDFRVGEVLRFSRLFPPQYPISIYKKKKKHDQDQKAGAKTGETPTGEAPTMAGMNWGVKPEPEQCEIDEQITFSQHEETKVKNASQSGKDSVNKETSSEENSHWRFGPAQLWFDRYGVPADADSFDYGLAELKEQRRREKEERGEKSPPTTSEPYPQFPDEAYLLVNQTQWESGIVWMADSNKDELEQSIRDQEQFAGWLVSNSNRTVDAYASSKKMYINLDPGKYFHSLFPIENRDLVYSAWESGILWDTDTLEKVPSPEGLTLDLNDENIVYEIPEDKNPNPDDKDLQTDKSAKKEPRKSTLALQKIGIVKEKEEEEDDERNMNMKKDPFNISNDEYYTPKLANDTTLKSNVAGNLIQHSTPAVDLQQPFFPTFMGMLKLRRFHRPPLKRYSHGLMSTPGPKPVLSLEKQMKRKARARDQERQSMGGGEIFFMRTPQDLTACDGDIVLAEYSEEFPPIMMQVGMATKVKNFYKRRPGGDNKPLEFKYGELAYAHHSPFLGNLNPGQSCQAFENNMFRAPIYQHLVPETDFLVIRNRQNYYIRKISDIFCVGQICPLIEVPGPNSKRANIFIRDFLQSFIYRLFWSNIDNPKRIRMEDIKRSFQSHSESSIRKRLKQCADFKRTGNDSNWWVIKPDFRLPTHDEIRAMLSPEQCCAFYSLLAAEQRLKDAGYGEKSLFAPEADEDDEAKIEDEVKTAPWNTTRAYIQAVKGKCLLKLTGDTDPTGCGEGFAYVRIPNKPIFKNEQKEATPKKTVTGTNADLRRLNLADAKALLRSKGFPEAEIKKLSRWEIIDVVRTLSTQDAKAGEEGGMTKFARGNRFSVAEHQERYKEDCQRIFSLQNKMLESTEVLSSCDEDASDSNSDDSDYDEMGKNIESMLSNKKSSTQLSQEREEAELKQLQKSLLEPRGSKDGGKLTASSSSQDLIDRPTAKTLKITRTFKDDSGRLYTREEVVTKQLVIEAYLKIRKTKTDDFIKQFASLDETQKEEMKRERRRIQEQLRRIKRNQEKIQKNHGDVGLGESKYRKYKKNSDKDIKLKCGNCGQVGHMRTNKECPMYGGGEMPASGIERKASLNVAMTDEDLRIAERDLMSADQNLVSVEGTKVTLSKELLQAHRKVKEKSLTLDFSKLKYMKKRDKDGKGKQGKRRKAGTGIHCDYLNRPQKTAHRRRTDPLVSLCTMFEHIINDLKEMPNSAPFHVPVNPKVVLDYYTIIVQPMDLQTLRANVRERKYENREQFLVDVHQMLENSRKYNGDKSIYTITAQQMLELTLHRFAEKEERLMRLEKAINPLLDDNDQVAFSFILENIIENHIKTLDSIWPFLQPVNKKLVKDYYEVIERPMDIGTIVDNVKHHRYHSQEAFLSDIVLIHSNSMRYNGAESAITATAQKIVDVVKSALESNQAQLEEMEQGIAARQEEAMEGLESESIMTGTSFHDDLSNLDPDTESRAGPSGDYSIAEATDFDETSQSQFESSLKRPRLDEMDDVDIEDFVDIMDEDIAGDEIESMPPPGFRAPSPYEDDSQASFDATAFFKSNFDLPNEQPINLDLEDTTSEPLEDAGGAPDVVNDDLRISSSEDESVGEIPAGGGFDFDDFE